jgi:hypothetical protein
MCSVLYIVVCPFVLFLLAIVLSVLRFTYSDYPFGILKLFLIFREGGHVNEYAIKCLP